MPVNKIIQSLLNTTPDASWIMGQAGLAWLQLDIDIPVKDILDEWESVKHRAVPHRMDDKFYNMSNVGWESLTIFGAGAEITTKTDQPFDWTDIAVLCPKTGRWIEDNFTINQSTGRIRFMMLRAGGLILPHKDRATTGLKEINVAITNPDGCVFKFLKHGVIPFKDSTAFMIDTSNEHLVYNASNQDRLHIILHADIDDSIVEQSYASRYHHTRY